jgi:hypothetical protein
MFGKIFEKDRPTKPANERPDAYGVPAGKDKHFTAQWRGEDAPVDSEAIRRSVKKILDEADREKEIRADRLRRGVFGERAN